MRWSRSLWGERWRSATTAELKAEPRQEKVATGFAFRNDGPRAVRFVSLQPSCNCLEVDKPLPDPIPLNI
ncbi:MAG: hypothetical protein CK548_09445 [Opitutia bacterium]|nr:MAG: hypothetical protein CK548_09445 [Opitutae bacterium]